MVYQKPETALKRVEELEAVGQNSQAYALLLEIIVSKRTRQTPMAVVEPIMKRFVELSIKLRKAKTFKEGLNQYKNICLQAGQLEATSTAVLEFLIKSVEILNKYEPGTNDEQFTIDKQFIWEAYRIGVDSLRNHAELDFAYHKVAVDAINFLKEYNMRSEFKRLAEALRLHLSYTIKGSSQPSPVNLADPFTLQRHLDTRFYISQAAKDMKLWNECFRAVEDIHCLLELSSTNPDQKSILKYFEVLQQVWLFGDDYLFHAAAYQKYFNGLMEQGALDSSEKIGQMATTMLISALAAPTAQSNDDKWRAQRNVRFMLYDSVPPSRAELLDYALSKDIFKHVSANVKELYEFLEIDFHPLTVCQRITPLLNYFANDCELSHYLKPLHQVILTKLFSQLSEVYSTIKIQAVVELLSPFKCSRFEIEQFAIHGCRIGSFRLTIDHSNGLFVFEDSNFCSKSLPVIELQSRLDEFSKRLVEVAALIDKDFNKTLAKQRKARFLEALENLERDRELTIERRNRMLENAEKRQDFLRTKEQERLQRVIELQQAEEARLAEHEKLLASQRLEQQRKEIERNESLKTAKKLVEELQALGIKVENEDLQNPDRLRDIQAEHIEKQRRELEIKARALAKKCDHTIRAFAREEIPLLEKEYKVQSVKDLEDYETSKLKSINEAKAKYVKILSLKKSLAHVMEDFSAYRKKMVDSRLAEYEAVKNESLKKLEEEKAARLSAHKLELAAKAKEEQDKIRQQQEADEVKKIAAEKEKERLRKLDEQLKKQREKEAEIEAKLSAPKPTGPSSQPENACKPAFRAAESRTDEIQRSETSKPAWKPGQGKWRSVAANDGSTVSPPSEPSSTQLNSARGSRVNFDSGPARPAPSAFSSLKKPDGSTDSKSKPATGPPKIGSGKWANRRQQ